MSDLSPTSIRPARNPSVEVERFKSFSDAIFAIILTIMIFNLKPPSLEGWPWFFALWPTVVAYGLSYLFVAVCWLNHHYNLRHVQRVYAPLIWTNFIFLFWMSFLPFSTSFVASSRFSHFSLFIYALTFLPMVGSYMVLECVITFGKHGDRASRQWWWIAFTRGFLTLAIYASAAALAYPHPRAAFILILTPVFLYVFPENMSRLGLRGRGCKRAAHTNTEHPCAETKAATLSGYPI